MKIALVCKIYPTSRPGGMGFVCQDRARELERQGHEVRVLTTGLAPHNGKELDDRGVQVHHMPCAASRYSDEFAKHVHTHVTRYAPDILHLDSFDCERPWWRDFKSQSRLAITMHGFSWGAFITRLNLWKRGEGPFPTLNAKGIEREYKLLAEFHRVIGVSLHEHWLLRELMGVLSAQLVYNPIPNYFFTQKATAKPPENPRWLCAAVSGHSERGFHLAKKAADQAGVELVVAGSHKREEMPGVLDGCTGLVLPTAYAQGYDLSVVEALVRSKPVIACATGSYLREAELMPSAIRLVPQTGIERLAKALAEPTTWFERPYLSKHSPIGHVTNWLGAIL